MEVSTTGLRIRKERQGFYAGGERTKAEAEIQRAHSLEQVETTYFTTWGQIRIEAQQGLLLLHHQGIQ